MFFPDKHDLALLSQKTKDYYTKCVLLDDNLIPVDEFQGVVMSGNFSIDADSNVRRTMNLEIDLSRRDEFSEIEYFTHYIQIYIGIFSLLKRDIIWYNMGIYNFDSKSHTYDASTNTLSLNTVDMMGMLDADHRGVLYGASQYVIRALNDDGTRIRDDSATSVNGQPMIDVNGEPYYNSLRNALIGILKQANINKYIIEDIGVYSVVTAEDSERDALAESFFNNSGVVINQKVGDQIISVDSRYNYDEVPYNLEFALGSSIADEIIKVRDLYLGYESYFDIDGVFRCNMIPTLYEDPVLMDAKYFDSAVISESSNTNIYDVKNTIEVWGQELSVDNYTSEAEKIAHTADAVAQEDKYVVTLDSFESLTPDGNHAYTDGMVLGLKFFEQNNYPTVKIQVVSDDGTEYPIGIAHDPTNGSAAIAPSMLQEGVTYLFRWSAAINGWYYLGQYKVHAVAVLTDGSHTVDDIATEFNCDRNAVHLEVNPDSPYTVEKIGFVVKVLNDGDYVNIYSDLLAKSEAEYELWKYSRRTDNISIEALWIPFLDVNTKIEYTKQGDTEPTEYIVKKVSGNLDSGTMDVEMMTFYPLYQE